MSNQPDKWFVEEFHLRSPVEEFEQHARHELQRIAGVHNPHEDAYRRAADLVTARLRRNDKGTNK